MADGGSRIGFVCAPAGHTVLDDVHVTSPLALTRSFHVDRAPAGLCTVILQSTVGALVPGDEMALELIGGPGAQAHVTTQGATVVQGGESPLAARQRTCVRAGPGSLVELLPEPLVLFPGARLVSDLQIDLADGAVVLALEVVAGYDPGGTGLGFATLATSTTVRGGGSVLATERLELAGADDLDAPGLLGPARAMGALWAVGDVPVAAVLAAWRAVAGLAVARLPNDAGVVARRLGADGPDVGAPLREAWVAARTLLTGAPPAPRRTGSGQVSS